MFTKKWMCVAVVAVAMALSASMASASTITVLNGSFENPVTAAPGQADNPWTDGTWAFIPAPWTANTNNWGRAYQPHLGIPALTGGGVQVANVTDSGYDVIAQPLGSYSFDAGDTLSLTFYLLRDEYGTQGGILRASFLDGATTLVSQDFDTTEKPLNTWAAYTFFQTIGAAVTAADLQLQFSNVSGRVGWLDLVSNVTVGPEMIWNGGTSETPPTDGGGTWNTTPENTIWWDGGAKAWADDNDAVFGAGNGTAGDVAVEGTVRPTAITFNAATEGTYRLTQGAAGLIDLNGNEVKVTANVDAEIAATITNGSLIKAGDGTLTLSGTNTHDGTAINAGTLSIANDAALGTGGTLTFAGGTLKTTAGITSDRPMTVAAAGGTFDTNTFDSVMNGILSGTGGLTKAGDGTLTLNNVANDLTGSATVNAGTLTVNAGSIATLNVPAGAANLNSPATATTVSVSGTGLLALGGTVGTLNVTGGTVNVGPGASVGTGNFTNTTGVIDATNPLTITSSANLVGATVASAGPSFTVSGEVLNPTPGNHRIITAQGGTLTVIPGSAGVIGSGSGSATIDPATGVWTLTGNVGVGADFHYWRYAKLPAGNFDVTVQVLTGQGNWGQAGIVARDSLDQGSNWATVKLTDDSVVDYLGGVDRPVGDNGCDFWDRSYPGGAPRWLNIKKVGNDVSFFYKDATDAWVQIGVTQTYPNWGAGAPNYIGLGVGNGDPVITGTFGSDNIFASAVQADLSTTNIAVTENTALILPVNWGAKLGGLSLKGGSLNVTNDLAMAAGSTYRWEFSGGEADKVNVTGNLAFAGAWTLVLAGTDTPTPGTPYDLFTYTGSVTDFVLPTIDKSEVPGWLTPTITKDDTHIYMMFGLMGDANGDLVVDAADYIILKQNFGMTDAEWSDGDFSGNGTVDWDDLQILMANFSTRTIGGAPAIPEPATLGLLAIGALAVLRRRRRVD